MKTKILSIIILFLITFNIQSYSQDGVYTSLIASNNLISMTLKMDGDTVYAFRQEIPYDANDSNIVARQYNLTDIKYNGNEITIPNTGTYWFIPFEDTVPILMPPGIYVETCENRSECGSLGGTCAIRTFGGNSSCSCASGGTPKLCLWTMRACNG